MLKPGAEGVINNEYGHEIFGANFLSPSNKIGDDGNFDEVAEKLDLQFVRYPGGSLTEYLFDISDPTRTWNIDDRDGEEKDIVPMDEFFAYAEDAGMAVTVVIPTRTQLSDATDANGERFPEIDEAELRGFISDILDGKYGSPQIQAFEIGNEYWGAGEMSALEYGRLSSEMAEIINSEISAHPRAAEFQDTDILVQMGMNYNYSDLSDKYGDVGSGEEQLAAFNEDYGMELSADKFVGGSGNVDWIEVNNMLIMREFDDDELEAVDGIVAHVYGKVDVDYSKHFEFHQLENTWWADERTEDLELYVTEWNQKRDANHEEDENFGLKQAHEMLNLIESFGIHGVDAAHLWSPNLNASTALTTLNDEELRVPGEMFNLMHDSLVGMKPLLLNPDDHDEAEIRGDGVDLHAFYSEDQLTAFVSSTSDQTQEQIIDFNGLVSDVGSLTITRLGVEPGDDPDAMTARPVLTEEDPEELIQDGILITDLKPYEILVIEMDQPEFTFEIEEGEQDDFLSAIMLGEDETPNEPEEPEDGEDNAGEPVEEDSSGFALESLAWGLSLLPLLMLIV